MLDSRREKLYTKGEGYGKGNADMYTVVVADDEAELRRSLIERTPWEECGFQVVGEAENGMDALEQVERLAPDLLLTDIRMPFLSGIALAREVREIRPAMHIAFLSGYDDFTYAQQAIEYNIISYLLKPISSQELARELKTICAKMDKHWADLAQSRAERLHPHDFLMPLLLGADTALPPEAAEKDLARQAAECGLITDEEVPPHFVVLATEIEDGLGRVCTDRAHVHAVETITEKYLRSASCLIGGRVLTLVAAGAHDIGKYLHIAVSEITQSLERVVGGRCTVGVSREIASLSGCHAAYREAVGALHYTSEEGAGETRYIADLEHARAIRSDFTEAAAQLEGLIKGGSTDQLTGFLDTLFGGFQTGAHDPLEIDLMMVQLLAAVCRSIGAVVDPDAAGALWSASPLSGLSFSCRSPGELKEKMTDFCLRAKEAITDQCRESGEVLCEQAIGMIQSGYGDESLSLGTISEKLHISPNYLSALIRKNAGDTFINLLTAKRLDTARELLTCTSLKVMEIASRCGYSDQHYFSYCFKKRFGISPITLRRQGGAEEGGQG